MSNGLVADLMLALQKVAESPENGETLLGKKTFTL